MIRLIVLILIALTLGILWLRLPPDEEGPR